MSNVSWSCPLCMAAHGDALDGLSKGIILTHQMEHTDSFAHWNPTTGRVERTGLPPVGTPGNPARLFPPETCMVCFHPKHFDAICTDIEHTPGPNDTDIESPCQCVDYVNEEMAGRFTIPPLGDPVVQRVDFDVKRGDDGKPYISSPDNCEDGCCPTGLDGWWLREEPICYGDADGCAGCEHCRQQDGTHEGDCYPADDDPGPDPTILEEAQGLTRGDRQAAYGHPMSDFQAMGRITAAIIGRWLESEGYVLMTSTGVTRSPLYFPDIPPRVATMLMQSVKLSREAAKPARDNRVDGAGYWDCTQMAVEADINGRVG